MPGLTPILEIRQMERGELDLAIEWARLEGWNPGLDDADAFWSVDPSGFFVATADGEPVGSVSAVAYDSAFAFVGFFIVRPEYRRGNIGGRLAQQVLRYLGERSSGADGVVAQLENYGRLGYKLAYSNIRFQGRCIPGTANGYLNAASVPIDELAAYDRAMFPADRREFLSRWIQPRYGRALCAMDCSGLHGYGVIRKCHEGYKIGPLFANTREIASSLLTALTGPYGGETFYLDVPEPNSEAMGLALSLGMQEVFRTGRIYRRDVPSIDLQRVFGVTSFELG